MNESNILHCDLNNFFASVECVKNNEYYNVPMIVCGDPKLRHGIVLAKNNIAKKYGIITGETIYSARKKCPNLVLASSNYDDYIKYSNLVNQIYLKYTNKVEPLSIDECFLDVSESVMLFGDSIKIANLIKEDVKKSTGLTISVGVSFNKSFAKIGSDMKKTDAVTVIDYTNFKRILYPQDVSILMSIGKTTKPILNKYGINTVGDLAHFNLDKLRKILGNKADEIYNIVKGNLIDEVKNFNCLNIPKSVSKGNTFSMDENDIEFLEKNVNDLCEKVSENLRRYKLKATVICLGIKDSNFITITRQKHIKATNTYGDIAKLATEILKENYDLNKKIRSLTVFANNLVSNEEDNQLNLFNNKKIENIYLEKTNTLNNDKVLKSKKQDELNNVIDKLKARFGENSITYASTSNLKNERKK